MPFRHEIRGCFGVLKGVRLVHGFVTVVAAAAGAEGTLGNFVVPFDAFSARN